MLDRAGSAPWSHIGATSLPSVADNTGHTG
jgi:hypothetical protein